ncbi:uncharacterized protein L203_105337 [Cryptococcus depauperatus CBS 7841]|uniref:Uncharacterized protein n=1 Tax=Cryptococcus depauperatus CBS 7841 TaxID=1295531 RepID=A0A1E3HNG6_9TREE|nr:MSP domain-containing protein [Cryptococcus depauperatus CBS 7841]
MSVELSPSTQLGFPRPFNEVVKRSLFIHNPNSHPVAFKVKTTAPKQYSVRPNSGRVEAGESVEVHIMLQPLAQEPPPHAKCKDKFLVQSAFITPDEEMHTLAEMWTQVEKTNKAAITERKLKVVYLPAEDGSETVQGIPEEVEEGHDVSKIEESHNQPHDGLTRWTTKPDKEYDPALFRNAGYTYWEIEQPPYKPPTAFKVVTSYKPTATAIFSHAQTSPTHEQSRSPVEPVKIDLSNSAFNQPPLPPLSPADIQPTNAALETSLSATATDSEKLQVALKEIERLRAELIEAKGPNITGLRKRGVPGSIAEAVKEPATTFQTAQQQGVPLEVVVGLVAGVFVLTYLFF